MSSGARVNETEAAIRVSHDILRTVNWFRLKRMTVQVSRNRKRAGRNQKQLGSEHIIIEIVTGPGGIHENADKFIGSWEKEELLLVWDALKKLRGL